MLKPPPIALSAREYRRGPRGSAGLNAWARTSGPGLVSIPGTIGVRLIALVVCSQTGLDLIREPRYVT